VSLQRADLGSDLDVPTPRATGLSSVFVSRLRDLYSADLWETLTPAERLRVSETYDLRSADSAWVKLRDRLVARFERQALRFVELSERAIEARDEAYSAACKSLDVLLRVIAPMH
jgi:hypothetical protein